MASTAPSAGPGRCLRSGGLGLPPLASVRLGPGGSGPVGLVPSGVWAAPVPWHRIVWLSAWLSRAVVPSCREFHGVLRHRQRISREKLCAAHAVQRVARNLPFTPRPGLGPLASAGREASPRRGPCGPPFLVRRAHPRHSALPSPFGGPASRTLSASPGVAGAPPGSPGGPCAGLVVGAFRSSRRPPGRALAYG
jgi:hypothetical protein